MIPSPSLVSSSTACSLSSRAANAEASLVALTKTEIKVLALLGRGQSDKEIAASLTCGVKTIKNAISTACSKLSVSTAPRPWSRASTWG